MNSALTLDDLRQRIQDVLEADAEAKRKQPILLFHCRQEVINLAIVNNIAWQTITDLEKEGKILYSDKAAPGHCLKLDASYPEEWWQP